MGFFFPDAFVVRQEGRRHILQQLNIETEKAKTKAARARPDPGSSPPATPVGEVMGEVRGAL